jgi:hypothetical protein
MVTLPWLFNGHLTENPMYRLIIAGALLAAPTFAAADGYEGSMKDGASYAYSYSVKQQRGSWTCPAEFSRRECSKIRQEVARRQARETRPRKVVVERRIPVYRDSYSSPVRAAFGGKRCAGFFSIKGDARPVERFARGSALKEWRKLVRTSDRGGEAYIDESYSPNFKVHKCQITGDRGLLLRCTAEGTACRP